MVDKVSKPVSEGDQLSIKEVSPEEQELILDVSNLRDTVISF